MALPQIPDAHHFQHIDTRWNSSKREAAMLSGQHSGKLRVYWHGTEEEDPSIADGLPIHIPHFANQRGRLLRVPSWIIGRS